MKKTSRKISWSIVYICIFLFLISPVILLLNLNQNQLDHIQNEKDFENFVSNIRLCILASGKEEIDIHWIEKNCQISNIYPCQNVKYEKKVLFLEHCVIRNEVFSYRNTFGQ